MVLQTLPNSFLRWITGPDEKRLELLVQNVVLEAKFQLECEVPRLLRDNNYEEALGLLDAQLTKTRELQRSFKQGHGNTLEIIILRLREAMAGVLKDTEDLENAKKEALEVLEERVRLLRSHSQRDESSVQSNSGDDDYIDHQDTRALRRLLCEILQAQGETEKKLAEKLHRQVWNLYDGHSGLRASDIDDWRVENGYALAVSLRKRGRLGDAVRQLDDVLEACAEDAPRKMDVAKQLFVCVTEQKEMKRADTIFNKHFWTCKPGDWPSEIIKCVVEIGKWRMKLERCLEAEKIWRRIINHEASSVGTDVILDTKWQLSMSLFKQGQFHQAKNELISLKRARRLDPEHSTEVVGVYILLAWVYYELQQQPEMAREYAERVWSMDQSCMLGPQFSVGIILIWDAFLPSGLLDPDSIGSIWTKVLQLTINNSSWTPEELEETAGRWGDLAEHVRKQKVSGSSSNRKHLAASIQERAKALRRRANELRQRMRG